MTSETINLGPARSRSAWLLLAMAGAVASVGTTVWFLRSALPDRDPMRLVLLRAAMEEYNAGRYQKADALLARRAADGVTTSADWVLRACIAGSQGRFEDALGYLGHVPETDPIAAQAWMQAGRIERVRHRLRAAESAFRHALAIDPAHVQSHSELAYVYVLQRRKDEGNAEFRELARLTALDYRTAFAWSQNDCDIFDPQESLRLLIPVVATDPDDRWSRLALADNYRATHWLDLADATLQPLAESDPDVRAIRAQIALERGEPEVAIRLVQGGPDDHARLNCFRGRLALRDRDLGCAADRFDAAVYREPRDREALHGLVTTLLRLGDPRAEGYLLTLELQDELKRTIIESGAAGKVDVELFIKLAELCEALGRTDQACAWYQVARDRDPLDHQAQQGFARLGRRAVEPIPKSRPSQDRLR
jgi:tetratricopeptide (TPR) repeat protein